MPEATNKRINWPIYCEVNIALDQQLSGATIATCDTDCVTHGMTCKNNQLCVHYNYTASPLTPVCSCELDE